MLLKRVNLENFISHKSSELEFDYGINVITGPNGAGKTSILDAVSFGLFNVHSRGKNENLVHRSAEKSKVVVEFNEGGVSYSVEWDIDRKKKQAKGVLFKLQDDEKSIIARGGGRVITSEVEKLTGLDETLFMQSIYVQQGEIERLVTTTPADRKQIISKLLGIEHLEKAYQHMREVVNEYQNIASKLSGELKRKPEVENQIQSLSSELESLKSKLEAENKRLSDIESEIQILEAKLKELDHKKEIFIGLNSQKAVLDVEISNLNINLKRKEAELIEAEKAFARVESLKKVVAKLPLMDNYLNLLRKMNKKEKEMDLEHQKLERVESLKEALSKNEESYKAYLKKSTLLKQKREERKNYEGAKEELTRVENQLQTDLKKRDKKLKDISQKLEEYSQALGEKVTQENAESVLATKKGQFDRLKNELEEKADRIKQEIGTVKGQIKDIEFKLSKISEADVCPICGRELTPKHRAVLQQEFENIRSESHEKIGRLEGELRTIDAEKKKCEKSLEKLASINLREIKGITGEIEELKADILQEQSEIDELKRKVEALKKIDGEIMNLEKEVADIEDAYQDYEAARREIIKWPSKEEIEANLDRLNEEINTVSKEIEGLIGKLGYRPENPEQELAKLRNRKEEFDRNEPLAKKKDSLLGEVQDLKRELGEKNFALEKVLADIKELAYDENFHKEQQKAFESNGQEKNKATAEVVRLKTEIKNKGEEKEKCESELKQLLEKEKEKATVEEFIRILESIRGAFHKDGLQRLIRARSRPLLEKITRDFFERFNLEFSDVQINDDYDISVIGPAGVQTIDQISGGERVALAIALRLAIARLLSGKVETIIMDEPTTHLDEERRKELVNILNSFFKEGGRIIPQMIVITHHHEIEDVADTLYNVNKKEGTSMVEVEDD